MQDHVPVLEQKEPVVAEQPSSEQPEIEKPEEQPAIGDKGESELPSTKTEKPIAELVQEARESTAQTTPPVKTTPTVRDESFYEGKDRSIEFTIKMGRFSDKAKPNWRMPIRLPEWAEEQELKAVIIYSFLVGPDGKISYLHVDKTSGYRDVDRAVAASLREWQFAHQAFGREHAEGTITLRINQ